MSPASSSSSVAPTTVSTVSVHETRRISILSASRTRLQSARERRSRSSGRRKSLWWPTAARMISSAEGSSIKARTLPAVRAWAKNSSSWERASGSVAFTRASEPSNRCRPSSKSTSTPIAAWLADMLSLKVPQRRSCSNRPMSCRSPQSQARSAPACVKPDARAMRLQRSATR